MSNLMIHAGAQRVDRDQLYASVEKMPARTQTHTPIPHHVLLEQVARALKAAGYLLVNGAHALTPNGQRYFGLLELSNSAGGDDYSLVVGIRNAHDKRFPAGLAVGSSVFVCDNLAFSSEIVIARRHTRFINRDLPSTGTRHQPPFARNRREPNGTGAKPVFLPESPLPCCHNRSLN